MYKRQSHGVIFDGNYFFIVGGETGSDDGTKLLTEKCSLHPVSFWDYEQVRCFSQNPELENYINPALFLIQQS